MIFANTLWGKRISVTCDKPSDFKFCSKACGPLAGLLWVFISEESICRLSKHQKRFQSSEHHLFQVSKSTFYFHTYFCYFHIVWGSVLLRSPSSPHAWDVLLPRISNALCAVSAIILFKVSLTFLSLSNAVLPLLFSPSLSYAGWSLWMFFLALWIFLSEAITLCEHGCLSNLCA